MGFYRENTPTKTHRLCGNPGVFFGQWLFLVPLIGPQVAVLPTTFWGNQKQPLIAPKFSFVFFCGGWDKKCVFRNQRLTDPSGSHCQIWSMSRAGRRFPKKMEDHGFGRKIGKNAANNLAHLRLALFP